MLWNTENIRFRYQIQNTKYKIWHTKIKIKSAKYILSSLTTCTTGNAHPPKVPSLQDVENAALLIVWSVQSCYSKWTQLQFPMFFPKKRFSPCVDENSPLYNAMSCPKHLFASCQSENQLNKWWSDSFNFGKNGSNPLKHQTCYLALFLEYNSNIYDDRGSDFCHRGILDEKRCS